MTTIVRKHILSFTTMIIATIAYGLLISRGDGLWATFAIALSLHLSFELDIIKLNK